MKTDNVPAIVMLSAGFVDCVIAIRMGQPLGPFVKQLFIVLITFYILGLIIKLILDRNFRAMDDEQEEIDLSELEDQATRESEDTSDEVTEDSSDEAQE